jgi:hypothetical protein
VNTTTSIVVEVVLVYTRTLTGRCRGAYFKGMSASIVLVIVPSVLFLGALRCLVYL